MNVCLYFDNLCLNQETYQASCKVPLIFFIGINSQNPKWLYLCTSRAPHHVHTVCQRSEDPFYKVTYYIKWITTSWAYGIETINMK